MGSFSSRNDIKGKTKNQRDGERGMDMNTPYVVDAHTHTLASGHAYGTIREMAAAAKTEGISLLGITEHGPGIPGTCHPFYFLNLEAVPRFIDGVEVLHGCEINVLEGGQLSLEERYLRPLDYGIVGIHRQCYRDQGVEGNTDNLIACMKHERVFFVSHPDDDHTPLDYERLVEAAKAYHVALEVNNSSFGKPEGRRLHHRENYRKMLALCKRLRVPVIVSSDAHDPSAVGTFDAARQMLREADMDEELVLNVSARRFKAFIGM